MKRPRRLRKQERAKLRLARRWTPAKLSAILYWDVIEVGVPLQSTFPEMWHYVAGRAVIVKLYPKRIICDHCGKTEDYVSPNDGIPWSVGELPAGWVDGWKPMDIDRSHFCSDTCKAEAKAK